MIRRRDFILIRFNLLAQTDQLSLPAARTGRRRDELWKTTCFEVFARDEASGRYVELNVSPGHDWAAYRFSTYRAGMENADIPEPLIRTRNSSTTFELEAEAREFADLPPDAAWSVGFCAVIETAGGDKSYWALAHPPDRPDFHHDVAFALSLPPSGAPEEIS